MDEVALYGFQNHVESMLATVENLLDAVMETGVLSSEEVEQIEEAKDLLEEVQNANYERMRVFERKHGASKYDEPEEDSKSEDVNLCLGLSPQTDAAAKENG